MIAITISDTLSISLSESLMETTLHALAHEGTPQSREVLLDMERQGLHLPVWIQRDVLGRGKS